MKCKIISISRKPSDWEKQAIQFYSKQLPDHLKISHIDVKPSSSKSMTEKSVVKNEGEEILKYIDDDAYLILWDRKGKKITSLGFAELIQEQADFGKNINFIIGGAFGSSEEIIQKSQLMLSASDLTFPHKLFKIFLIQLIMMLNAYSVWFGDIISPITTCEYLSSTSDIVTL